MKMINRVKDLKRHKENDLPVIINTVLRGNNVIANERCMIEEITDYKLVVKNSFYQTIDLFKTNKRTYTSKEYAHSSGNLAVYEFKMH